MVDLLSKELDLPVVESMELPTDEQHETEEVTQHHDTQSHNDEGGAKRPEILTELRDDDVLLGRGKSHAKRPANIRFHHIITTNRARYFGTECQKHKKAISEEIMNQIGGRFLRRRDNRTQTGWVEVSREMARVKVAQALQYRQRTQENNNGPTYTQKKNGNNKIRNRTGVESSKTLSDDKLATTLIPAMAVTSDNYDRSWQQPLALNRHELQHHSVEFISDDEIYWALNVDPVQLRIHNEALERGYKPAVERHINEQLVSNDFHNGVSSGVVVPKGSPVIVPITSKDFEIEMRSGRRVEKKISRQKSKMNW